MGPAQETYGEEPVLLAAMGTALAQGTRGVYNIEVGANAEDQGPVAVAVDLG